MVQDSFCLEIRPKSEREIGRFWRKMLVWGHFSAVWLGRHKVAYPTQSTIYNKKPIDTMPLSVLVYELEVPPNFGNR